MNNLIESAKKLALTLWKFFVSVMLSPRVKSLAWQCLGQLVSGMLAVATEHLAMADVSPATVVVLGLIIAQATKAANNMRQGKPTGLLAK